MAVILVLFYVFVNFLEAAGLQAGVGIETDPELQAATDRSTKYFRLE